MGLARKIVFIHCITGIKLFVIALLVIIFSISVKAQTPQKQSVDANQATRAIPMPTGGCVYQWEVIDGQEIGFPILSGNNDVPAFTAKNNTGKTITAHIRVKPSSADGFAYIPNNTSNNVTVVSTVTKNIVTHVNVDAQPYGVAVSPDGRYVYTVSTKDIGGHVNPGVVSVIETTGNTVVGRYTVGENAAAIAVNPNGKQAYVVNETTATISVLDLTSYGTVITSINIGQPYGIGVSTDGTRLYVATKGGQLFVIDTSNNQIIDQIPISLVYTPPSLVVSPDGAMVYIAQQGATNLGVVDVAARTEKQVSVGAMSPFAMALTPEGDKLYVSTSSGVTILNTADNSIKKLIPLPGQHYGVSVSPDGKLVFVVCQNPNSLEVISTMTDDLDPSSPINNDMDGALSVGNFIVGDAGCNTFPVTYTIEVKPPPGINNPGDAVSLSTHYGTSLTAQTISVGGANLKGPVTVIAPAHFEVSTDDITFKDVVTIGTDGDITAKEIFVRLKATAPVGTYHENVELTSPGAVTVEVPAEGTVLKTQLNIAADNKIKFFGDPLPVLTVAYTGFVNGEGPAQLTRQPVVTTTAAATSPLGEYPITASDAASSNYIFTYVSGKLKIVNGDISTPNAFTPNGDGINDTWEIKNLNLYANCTVEVLNRYGQRVYYTNGYPEPWSGTFNGQTLPTGTYYYIIRAKPGLKPLTGPISIIR